MIWGMEQNYATSFLLQAHKVGPLGRWAVGPLMLSIALYATNSVAQAQPSPSPSPTATPIPGRWYKTYKWVSGQASGVYSKDGISSRSKYSKPFSFDFTKGEGGRGAYIGEEPTELGHAESSQDSRGLGASVSAGGWGSAASVIGQGMGKVTYTWGPAAEGPWPQNVQVAPPTGNLSFSVYAYASAAALNKLYDTNRNKTGEEASASANGKSSPENAQSPTNATSRRLYSFDTKSGGPFTITADFAAHASIPGGRNGDEGITSLSFSMSSEEDDRSVTLSRSGAHDEWTDGDVTHGDTTYSYDSYGMDGMRPQVNTQHLVANFGGGWTTRTHYRLDNGQAYVAKGDSHQWSPSSDDPNLWDHWNHAIYAMPHGNLSLHPSGWDGTATGQTQLSFTYTVKDNRNNEGEITVKPKYVLHVHDPVEVISDTSYLDSILVTVFQESGMPIVRSETNDSGTITYGTAKSSGWSVNWSLDKDVLLFLKPLGISVDAGYESSSEEYVERTTPPTTVSPDKYRYLQVRHHYNRHTTNFWAYDTGGKNKRMVDAIADGNYQPPPGQQQEVPHEAFYDKYLGTMSDQFVWSEEFNRTTGAPERDPNATNDDPRQPNPKLPERSSNYS